MKILIVFGCIFFSVVAYTEEKVIFDFKEMCEKPKELLVKIQKDIKAGDHTFQNYVYSGSALTTMNKFEEAVELYEKGFFYLKENKDKAGLYALQALAYSIWTNNINDEKEALVVHKQALKKIKRAVAYDPSNVYFAQMFHLYAVLAKDKLEENLALKKIKQVDSNAAGKEVFLGTGLIAVVFASGVLTAMYIQGDEETEDKVIKVIEKVLMSVAYNVVNAPFGKY
ncbi:hypothetical protein [Candidatus Uabimicrobium sp. HlEnr_7]|uniref:hypothetical protein n=1 Tax=Candidatus Uabimicrobium helgolandensis TaxID=3095367 RepID=UPI0035584368